MFELIYLGLIHSSMAWIGFVFRFRIHLGLPPYLTLFCLIGSTRLEQAMLSGSSTFEQARIDSESNRSSLYFYFTYCLLDNTYWWARIEGPHYFYILTHYSFFLFSLTLPLLTHALYILTKAHSLEWGFKLRSVEAEALYSRWKFESRQKGIDWEEARLTESSMRRERLH